MRTRAKILLVQFYSGLLNQNENEQATKYYDKLYRTLPGYNRFGPTWEIPVWIAEMKRNFPDADITFAKSIADVQAKQGNYTHLAFSALDCNWHLIRTIADGFSGTVIVGGYCEPDNLQDLQNVFWFDSVQHCVDVFGTIYKTGVDYTDFAGAKTIARLTLSTGCKHKCKFCVQPDDVVKTPIADVYQQADEICRLNSPLVYINDKTFGQCENFWLLPELHEHLRQNQTCGFFDGFIVQTTPSQLLRLDDDFLLASGIRYVELGIETYNDSILRAMIKPAREKTIDAATKKLRRLGIKLIPNILIGLPNENAETYCRTLQYLSDNADVISHLNIYNVVVYADSGLASDIEFADNAIDENVVGKAWHTISAVTHELFATMLYTFAANQLPDACDDCLTSRSEQDTSEICERCKAETIADTMKRLDAEISCDSCGSETDVKTYTVDQDGEQINACQNCVDEIIGSSMVNACDSCLTSRSTYDTSKICAACDKPDADAVAAKQAIAVAAVAAKQAIAAADIAYHTKTDAAAYAAYATKTDAAAVAAVAAAKLDATGRDSDKCPNCKHDNVKFSILPIKVKPKQFSISVPAYCPDCGYSWYAVYQFSETVDRDRPISHNVL